MDLVKLNSFRLKMGTMASLSVFLVACGGGGGTDSDAIIPPVEEPSSTITDVPLNQISGAYLRDQDAATGKLAGTVVVETNASEASDISRASDTAKAESVWVYWADEYGNKLGEPWLKTDANAVYSIVIPAGTLIPENISALLLYPANHIGHATQGRLVAFHDFIGNTALSGRGGNESQSWYYGDDRPHISVQRTDAGVCIFDNGLVSVTDMDNTSDDAWEATAGEMLANEVDENTFPPYQLLCDENPVHNADKISDEYGVWTYSTLNDAMFYGTVVYDSFLKYLGSRHSRIKFACAFIMESKLIQAFIGMVLMQTLAMLIFLSILWHR